MVRFGCGHSILPDWRKNEEASIRNGCSLICGLDYEYESLLKNESIQHKVRGDISKLPYKNGAFDCVNALILTDTSKNLLNRCVKLTGFYIETD